MGAKDLTPGPSPAQLRFGGYSPKRSPAGVLRRAIVNHIVPLWDNIRVDLGHD